MLPEQPRKHPFRSSLMNAVLDHNIEAHPTLNYMETIPGSIGDSRDDGMDLRGLNGVNNPPTCNNPNGYRMSIYDLATFQQSTFRLGRVPSLEDAMIRPMPPTTQGLQHVNSFLLDSPEREPRFNITQQLSSFASLSDLAVNHAAQRSNTSMSMIKDAPAAQRQSHLSFPDENKYYRNGSRGQSLESLDARRGGEFQVLKRTSTAHYSDGKLNHSGSLQGIPDLRDRQDPHGVVGMEGSFRIMEVPEEETKQTTGDKTPSETAVRFQNASDNNNNLFDQTFSSQFANPSPFGMNFGVFTAPFANPQNAMPQNYNPSNASNGNGMPVYHLQGMTPYQFPFLGMLPQNNGNFDPHQQQQIAAQTQQNRPFAPLFPQFETNRTNIDSKVVQEFSQLRITEKNGHATSSSDSKNGKSVQSPQMPFPPLFNLGPMLESMSRLASATRSSGRQIGPISRDQRFMKIVRYKEKLRKWREAHPVKRKFAGRRKVAFEKPRVNGKFVKMSVLNKQIKKERKNSGSDVQENEEILSSVTKTD